MLDTDTKRRIDTCRDILVGKVPDPKSQVEQITIALIYKFMDDMDLEAEELGGERRFFTKEYERYRWAKLVAPGVSGQDMLNTYSEALTKMVENEGLPKLFRDIFRNAYLPYRDPETLRAFLREIDTFIYDHSERLGDAFEYLLSVLGSQGDAGQFRTPRHIIDFMVDIISPQKNETILDPACGTAGFLISAYKHILKQNSSAPVGSNGNSNDSTETDAAEQALESPMRYPGDLLQSEDRDRLARNLKGYDISPDMVRLSLVNLYLHGFADPKVEEYDTLTSEDKWTEMADVILANPPFMSPKGGIKPHTRFQVQSKRSEVLFVDYIAEHLTPNGRAAIVVPEGIIFQSQTAYVALRKMLVENHLAAVISLPAGVFNPYSSVKTSILILDRAVAKASDHVAFFKIENDGFALGAQRKALKGSQLAQVRAELGAWLRAARAGGSEGLESNLGSAVERSEISKGGEFNLSAERYRASAKFETTFPLVPLGDLCELVRGVVFSREDEVASGGVPVLRANNIDRATQSIVLDDVKLVQPKADFSENKKLKAGDVFICLASGSKDHIGKVAFVETDTEYYFGGFMGSIRCNAEKLLPRYLYQMLTDSRFNEFLRQQIAGANINNLGSALLYRYEIPLPPLEVQREILAEIEGYHRVIDGARAVLNNYRPHIPVNPEWPMVELANVATFKSGGTPSKEIESYWSGTIPWVSAKDLKVDLISDALLHISEKAVEETATQLAPIGSVLVLVRGMGLANGVPFGEVVSPCAFNQDLKAIVPNNEVILTRFMAHALRQQSEYFKRAMETAAHGTLKINSDTLRSVTIPLPVLADQQAIVDELEAELALVNGNRDLIVRLEKKIDAAIARVWAEAKTEVAA